MRAADRLEKFRREGVLSDAQAGALASLERGEPLSLHGEIRALLYVGALLIAAGVGMTLKDRLAAWGPLVLLGGITAGVLACGAYAVRRAPPWSKEAVAAPTLSFDYILFLGCLLLSLDLGYAENLYHLLGGGWPRHLLLLAGVFGAAAYRYDNRLVLSLSLSSLAAWFGLELKGMGFFWEARRWYAVVFGGLCLTTGLLTRRAAVKAHFLDVYLNFAAHFLGAAFLSGVEENKLASPDAYALAALVAAAALYAVRSRRFLYLAWAVLYGYAEISTLILSARFLSRSVGFLFFYFIASSAALVAFLAVMSRRWKEES
jgi:hypothetical protein